MKIPQNQKLSKTTDICQDPAHNNPEHDSHRAVGRKILHLPHPTLIARLSTANRLRVSIRGRSCRICLTSSLITMQNLVAVSQCVHAYRKSQKFWGRWAPPLEREAWITPQKHAQTLRIDLQREYVRCIGGISLRSVVQLSCFMHARLRTVQLQRLHSPSRMHSKGSNLSSSCQTNTRGRC